MRFDDLNLIPALLSAVRAQGYTAPTPIQEQAIPLVLSGRDVLGCAQTGTGKTAAFALPIIQRLGAIAPHGRRPTRVLVVTPTRELATQIGDCFRDYGAGSGLRHTVIFGGVGQTPQVQALQRGVDVLVATPGRLLDLLNQGHVRLQGVEVFVLDEADRMLDMGFIHDIRKIVAALPRERQTLLFSATLPPDIAELARGILRDPVRVSVAPPATTVEAISQVLYHVEKADKPALLAHLLADREVTRALVFTRTKHGADKVVRYLTRGNIPALAIHGNKSQNNRERALAGFKDGRTRVLVATDIASRGLDIDAVSHVFNFDLPYEPEAYVHRIGRTGRAGATGAAVAFCSSDERPLLRDIEKLIRQRIPVIAEHPFAASAGRPRSSPPADQPAPQVTDQRAPQPARRDHPGGGRRFHGRGNPPRPRPDQRAAAAPRPAGQPGAVGRPEQAPGRRRRRRGGHGGYAGYGGHPGDSDRRRERPATR